MFTFKIGQRVTITKDAINLQDSHDPWLAAQIDFASRERYGIITSIDVDDSDIPAYVTVDFGDEIVLNAISTRCLNEYNPQTLVEWHGNVRVASEEELMALEFALRGYNQDPSTNHDAYLTADSHACVVKTGDGETDWEIRGVVNIRNKNCGVSLRCGSNVLEFAGVW